MNNLLESAGFIHFRVNLSGKVVFQGGHSAHAHTDICKSDICGSELIFLGQNKTESMVLIFLTPKIVTPIFLGSL